MNNDREMIHAALHWHAAHARRMAIMAERRQAENAGQYWAEGPRITEAKRQERACLRSLAKACLAHRARLDDAADAVIDVDAKLLAHSDHNDTFPA